MQHQQHYAQAMQVQCAVIHLYVVIVSKPPNLQLIGSLQPIYTKYYIILQLLQNAELYMLSNSMHIFVTHHHENKIH